MPGFGGVFMLTTTSGRCELLSVPYRRRMVGEHIGTLANSEGVESEEVLC